MEDWQLNINCPLCGSKFPAKRALRHKNKTHPDLTVDDFVALIKGAVDRGEDVLDTKRVVAEGVKPSGKSVFDKQFRGTGKFFYEVLGGAVGLGKKS